MMSRNLPIPSHVSPGTWDITESPNLACVNIKDKQMRVPLGASDKDLAMRNHEMVHVKISVANPSKIKLNKKEREFYPAFEDQRVNNVFSSAAYEEGYHEYDMEQSGLQHLDKTISEISLKEYLKDVEKVLSCKTIPPVERIKAGICGGKQSLNILETYDRLNMDARNVIKMAKELEKDNLKPFTEEELEDREIEHFKRVRRRSFNNVLRRINDYKEALENIGNKLGVDAVAYAKLFVEACRDLYPSPKAAREAVASVISVMNECSHSSNLKYNLKALRKFVKQLKYLEELNEKQEQELKEIQEEMKKEGRQQGSQELQDMVDDSADAMSERLYTRAKRRRVNFNKDKKTLEEALADIIMVKEYCKLSYYKPSAKARKKRPVFVGAVPKHIHRLPFDGEMFERKLKGNGGTVLIDASGSMCIPGDELRELIEHAPGATVGVYAGTVRKTEGHDGKLWIVAMNGRMIDPSLCNTLTNKYGFNIVDVHALEWLKTQKAPRLWVSDGGVTGKDHSDHYVIARHCVKLCKMHSILRIPTVDRAITMFKSGNVYKLVNNIKRDDMKDWLINKTVY